MTITRIKLERFTAFTELDLPFSPGINVFVGANATGKTHLMKAVYVWSSSEAGSRFFWPPTIT